MTQPRQLSVSPANFIDIKATGGEHTTNDLTAFLADASNGHIAAEQLGAWLMAVRLKGMTSRETTDMTLALAASGKQLDWSALSGRPVVDKHSTGGVGDKVTIILVPLLAACGLSVPKLSGRGLGWTGGTIDKLEAIPGFNCNLTADQILEQTRRIGCAIGAQTPDLAPLDGLLYKMRDVTATVQSIPLIAASVMSKKLAAGAGIIVLDVTCGRGAFMTNLAEALELSRLMVQIGQGAGRRVRALITDMDEPLGRAVGNALEVAEAIEVLSGRGPSDVRQVVMALGSAALIEAGLCADEESATLKLATHLHDGSALAKFRELIKAQGGDPRVVDDPTLLGSCPCCRTSGIGKDGWIQSVDPMAIAQAALELGAGRRRKEDKIDHGVGIFVAAKTGDRVTKGQGLVGVHARDASQAERIARDLEESAFVISDQPVAHRQLILETI